MPKPVKSAFSVEGEGEPLFLIHGIGASRASFAGLIPHLKNEYRVISYDLRGHGASPKPTPPYTLDDLVEDLETALLRFLDRFLAGDHQHRHPAERGIGRSGHEIGRARPQGGDADAGLAGVATIGRSHEACALFVARQDQLDLGGAGQRIEEIEVFLAGHAENIFAALFLQTLDEQIGCFLLARFGLVVCHA